MKKYIALLLTLIVLMTMTACGSGSENGEAAGASQPAEQTANEPSGEVAGASQPVEETPETESQETVPIIFGNDTLGYVDLAEYSDLMRGGTNDDSLMQVIPVEKVRGFIQFDLLTLSEDAGFDDACDYLRSMFKRSSTPPGDEYQNKEEYMITLDGQEAFKMYGELPDSKDEYDTISYVGYVLANANGDYVYIHLFAPKTGTVNENGDPFRPSIEDYSDLIESTYTRTKP